MTPELIYCAGRNRKLAEIALRHGFTYGAQLPATVYYPPQFADQDWNHPNFEAYMRALETHRPRIATVLDWEREDQLPEVLRWAEAAAKFGSETIIIIPEVTGASRNFRAPSADVKSGSATACRLCSAQPPCLHGSSLAGRFTC